MKLSFLKSGLFRNCIILFPILVVGLIFLFHKKVELDITSSLNKFNFFPYSDKEQSGNSKVKISTSNKGIELQYNLHEGYAYPYAGVTIKSKASSGFIDLSKFDHIQIKVKASKGKRIPVYLGLFIPGYTDTSRILSYKYVERFIDLNKKNNIYKIGLNEFKSPTWWHQVNKVPENELSQPDYSKVLFINIQNCILINKGVEDTVYIEQILFYKDPSHFIIYTSIAVAFYYMTFGMFWYISKRNFKKELIIKYKHVETLDQAQTEQEKVISYISFHYSNPELSLEMIQKETGISELKISSIVKTVSELSFKQYLNRLRLEEAKRLLRDTNLQVSEIVYKVGYGNISHFNRVFKESEKISPTDFRKNITAKT